MRRRIIPSLSYSALFGLTCHHRSSTGQIMAAMAFSSPFHMPSHVNEYSVQQGVVVSSSSKRRRQRGGGRRLYSSSPRSASLETFDHEETTTTTTAASNKPPFYRMYYNDVYEVHLPPRHRFPMKKYAQVRTQLQQWISDLPQEEQEAVHCGKLVGRLFVCFFLSSFGLILYPCFALSILSLMMIILSQSL
jgi:hypothetical protein